MTGVEGKVEEGESSGADPKLGDRRSGDAIIKVQDLTVAYPLGADDSYVGSFVLSCLS